MFNIKQSIISYQVAGVNSIFSIDIFKYSVARTLIPNIERVINDEIDAFVFDGDTSPRVALFVHNSDTARKEICKKLFGHEDLKSNQWALAGKIFPALVTMTPTQARYSINFRRPLLSILRLGNFVGGLPYYQIACVSKSVLALEHLLDLMSDEKDTDSFYQVIQYILENPGQIDDWEEIISIIDDVKYKNMNLIIRNNVRDHLVWMIARLPAELQLRCFNHLINSKSYTGLLMARKLRYPHSLSLDRATLPESEILNAISGYISLIRT